MLCASRTPDSAWAPIRDKHKPFPLWIQGSPKRKQKAHWQSALYDLQVWSQSGMNPWMGWWDVSPHWAACSRVGVRGGCSGEYKDVPEGCVYTRPKKNIAFLNPHPQRPKQKVSICFVVQRFDPHCPREQQEWLPSAPCPRACPPQQGLVKISTAWHHPLQHLW